MPLASQAVQAGAQIGLTATDARAFVGFFSVGDEHKRTTILGVTRVISLRQANNQSRLRLSPRAD
jgi:hypothetical protein